MRRKEEMKTISDLGGNCYVTSNRKNTKLKNAGRPPKVKRGRPKRVVFPALPKPPQLKFFSSGCSVSGCANTDKWLFTLPEAEDLRELWLKFISRPDLVPDKNTGICQVHFERRMWKRGKQSLQPYAVPTLAGLKPECRIGADDNHEHKLEESPLPPIKGQCLFAVEEEVLVPHSIVPSNNYNNNDEDIENIETSVDRLSPFKLAGRGYRCPLCNKNLARRSTFRYHLAWIHPRDKISHKLLLNPGTALKNRKRDKVLPQLYNLKAERAKEEISAQCQKRIDVMLESTESKKGNIASKNEDTGLKNYILKEEQLESEIETDCFKYDEKPEYNPQVSVTLTQLETDGTEQLLESHTEVYNCLEPNEDKLNFEVDDASSHMFSISLHSLPVEKRLVVKNKLMDVVNAVVHSHLDPEKMIIAFKP